LFCCCSGSRYVECLSVKRLTSQTERKHKITENWLTSLTRSESTKDGQSSSTGKGFEVGHAFTDNTRRFPPWTDGIALRLQKMSGVNSFSLLTGSCAGTTSHRQYQYPSLPIATRHVCCGRPKEVGTFILGHRTTKNCLSNERLQTPLQKQHGTADDTFPAYENPVLSMVHKRGDASPGSLRKIRQQQEPR